MEKLQILTITGLQHVLEIICVQQASGMQVNDNIELQSRENQNKDPMSWILKQMSLFLNC